MNQEIGLRIQEVRKKKGLSRGDFELLPVK